MDMIIERLQDTHGKLVDPGTFEQLCTLMSRMGYRDFLSDEQGIITLLFLAGKSVFGILPTSGGKSLTFQTVARLLPGMTMVISPLIALMKDQTKKDRDGSAMYFNSDLQEGEKRKVLRAIASGKVKLLYVSPERLKSGDFKQLLSRSKAQVSRIVIDEAHCVVEWGYGFRVKYLHLARELESFEQNLPRGASLPVLLLTATASPWLQREIMSNLKLKIPRSNVIVQESGRDRPELTFRAVKCASDQQKLRWLTRELGRGGRLRGKRGIIFSAFASGGDALDATNAPKIAQTLSERGIGRVDCYHGKLNLDQRRKVQEDFQRGRLNVLVATKAFGMGVDMPKLDFIIHFYPPISLEEYWQEAGRGGRGMDASKGEHCECIVLTAPGDRQKLSVFPGSAGFVKVLGMFSMAARGEALFHNLPARGALARMLADLKANRLIRSLPATRILGLDFTRFKLSAAPQKVYKEIHSWMTDNEKNTKPLRRFRSAVSIRADSSPELIRIDSSRDDGDETLEYYARELNWFTEPEVGKLEMSDNEKRGRTLFTCFSVLDNRLDPKSMKALNRKISDFSRRGYAKLNIVFDEYLTAPDRKKKAIVLKYLAAQKPPA